MCFQSNTTVAIDGVWCALCQSARRKGRETGVHLDDLVQQQRHRERSGDSALFPAEKAQLAAFADRAVPDLLWAHDYADRRAGIDHRVAASLDPRTVPRQHRTFGHENEAGGRAGAREESRAKPVIPEPVDPGPNEAGPVIPGSTTRTCTESAAETAVPAAIQAGIRPGRPAASVDHDLASHSVECSR